MKKQSNSNKHLTSYIVVMLSLLVMNSCGQSNQNSDNTETSDSLASYVSEFDTLYNWEGVYYGQWDLTDELSNDNPLYSLTIQKDSIIFHIESGILQARYLLYSKSISPGKIKLLGLKDITEGETENLFNKDFGVLSIEKEGKKLIWESDYNLLGYNEKNHILLEDKEYDRYIDSMTAAVWRIMNVIDSAYKDQWIGSYSAELHYIKEKSYEEYDSIKKELRLDIMSDSIKVYINDTVLDEAIFAYGDADSVFLNTKTNNYIGAGTSIGFICKDKNDQYVWKSTDEYKPFSEIINYVSDYTLQNPPAKFGVANDSIILNKR